MIEQTATCACAGLTATATGDPVRVSICHCDGCKRRTGSAFALTSTWAEDQVRVAGETRQWTRIGEKGGEFRGEFCPTCGATIAYRIDARPGMVSIPAGAFADASFPAPHVEVFAEKAHPWIGKILPEEAQE